MKTIIELPQIDPMIVAIWCGHSKPTDLNEFLNPFVDELNELLLNGLFINGHQLNVIVRCFICDTPARAYIKGLLTIVNVCSTFFT